MNAANTRDTVLLEMDHRIKNHLQLLAAYAKSASKRRGLTVGELADDLADKLTAIAGAHDILYRARAEDDLDAACLFLETLVGAFAGAAPQIHIDCDPALRLRADELAPIGMIVSEAISNALKYAFPDGREGHIWLRLARDDDRLVLTIRDNGVGMPDLPPNRLSGCGLIETLARQLGGYARIGSAPFGGAMVSVVCPHA